jgi:uncharacterized membrane protein YphA (DoxX/SURF4 family)
MARTRVDLGAISGLFLAAVDTGAQRVTARGFVQPIIPSTLCADGGNMSTTFPNVGHHAMTAEHSRPAYQAYRILHIAFTVAPILAGIDKFFHLLCNWDQYLAPWIANLSPIGGHNVMFVVGVIEVIAGLLVAIKPKIGAPIVGIWLIGIIVNLLTMGTYFDIALRDLGLSLAAWALWRLSMEFDYAGNSSDL